MKTLNIIGFFSAILIATPCLSNPAQTPLKRGDGRLSISNYHENEYLEVVYKEGGRALTAGLKEIERIFRSRGDGGSHHIDMRLIELIDAIEDHFGADSVELISGYRSPAYNRALKLEGRGVASESLHTQGLAADIHIDEVTEEELFEFASSLKAGGVGIYPRFNFVHVDVGPVRSWREAPATERVLVGTENNPNLAWSAVTDKNEYRRGEDVSAKITNNGYGSQRFATNVWIERYRKGKWGGEERIEKKPLSLSVGSGESTTYGWTIPEDFPHGKYRFVIFVSKDFSVPPVYSNEFYVKRAKGER